MGMYDAIKDGLSVVQASDNIELLKSFMEIQNGYWEMQEELKKAKDEIKSLKEQLELKDHIVFRDNMYYILDKSGDDGPFCSSCFDEKKKLVRMHNKGNGYMCPVEGKVLVKTEEQIRHTESLRRNSRSIF